MELSKEQSSAFTRRLLLSRMRILCNHGFFGLLLMNVVFSIDENVETACTDGYRIIFGTEFLETLSDSELDFVMIHEIMHIVLKHSMRREYRDNKLFNVACDIVVNSNILLSNNNDLSSITLEKYGESMHLAPDGSEGHNYTAEEIYTLLLNRNDKTDDDNDEDDVEDFSAYGVIIPDNTWDDHSRWDTYADNTLIRKKWDEQILSAALAIESRDPNNEYGMLPAFMRRPLNELRSPQIDWRTILNNFVQDEIVDYSFSPPDRRFYESDYFLPDFNDTDNCVKDILFMIDTSGSMSKEMITAAFSEIKGAIEQFSGKLKGWLGFFDTNVTEPKEFKDVTDIMSMIPIGGGGTSFHPIFNYVEKHMETPPTSIIILTDGMADFPNEEIANGIPVLWLLNNETENPPWGKVARIVVD